MSKLAKYSNTQKENREQYLDKAFLIFRPDDFPLYLKPVRVNVPRTCALTGKDIEPGSYAYPCHSNPVRLSPYGPERCTIDAALKKGNGLLPSGWWAGNIPTTERLAQKGIGIEKRRTKLLEKETVKALSRTCL